MTVITFEEARIVAVEQFLATPAQHRQGLVPCVFLGEGGRFAPGTWSANRLEDLPEGAERVRVA